MKSFLVFLFAIASFITLAQNGQQYLYLQNTMNQKLKKLKLESTAYFSVSIDSSNGNTQSSRSYTTYNPTETAFENGEINFRFSAYSTVNTSYSENESYYHLEDYGDLMIDSTIRLNYSTENANLDFYITHQTKFRRVLYSVGVGLFCASIFNAFIVSPMIGMQNGSFTNYSWNRLWKSELYSGVGLALSIPLAVLFVEKDYFLQTTSSYLPIWRIVDEE